jgi:hypothetical protein
VVTRDVPARAKVVGANRILDFEPREGSHAVASDTGSTYVARSAASDSAVAMSAPASGGGPQR